MQFNKSPLEFHTQLMNRINRFLRFIKIILYQKTLVYFCQGVSEFLYFSFNT